MKRIETVFESDKMPKSKNILWLETSNSTPVLKVYLNGEWKSISQTSGGYEAVEITYVEGTTTYTLSNNDIEALKNYVPLILNINNVSVNCLLYTFNNTSRIYIGSDAMDARATNYKVTINMETRVATLADIN